MSKEYTYQQNAVRSFSIFKGPVEKQDVMGFMFAEGDAIRICRLLNQEEEIGQ